MSSVVIYGDTSGAITLAANAVAGTNTITVPAQTGTMVVSGPAFSAYSNATTNVTNSTWTKVALNNENFDTNSNFDSTTNYRFTPTVAGYYIINGAINWTAATTFPNSISVAIYKNGSLYMNTAFYISGGNTMAPKYPVSCLVYCNGSTDYIELYGYTSGGSGVQFYTNSYMDGCFLRGA